jgi:hypothetical protein
LGFGTKPLVVLVKTVIPDAGVVQVPSSRRKLVVPAVEAGTGTKPIEALGPDGPNTELTALLRVIGCPTR